MEHAAACVVNDGKLYAFTGDGICLLLNSIYKLVAVAFDGVNCVHPSDLALPQKVCISLPEINFFCCKHRQIWELNNLPSFIGQVSVENLKRVAYKNVNQFVPVDARGIFGPIMPLPNLQDETLSSPTSILQNHEFPFAHQGI